MGHASERLERIRHKYQQHGLRHTFQEVLLKACNLIIPLKILRGMTLEKVDPTFLECPAHFTPMFLDEAQLRAFAEEPGNGLSVSFLQEALGKGDQCYAILDGETLASYGWYSRKPTRIDPPHLNLHFNDDYVYMYKGFTDPGYRGQRLHAIGMNRALQHYLEQGRTGLISYVESSNYESLKSVFRLGYVQFGSIYLSKIFQRYPRLYSGRCRQLGFRVEPGAQTDNG